MLRVPWLTGLGGVSRLEPGPASRSAAPQARAPSLPQMLLLGKGPNPHAYSHPHHLPRSPLPGSPSWANMVADMAALWWTVGPPWGGGPGEGARAPAEMGYGTY